MAFLSILSLIGSIIWTVVVVFANGMSDAPTAAFHGGWSIAGVWALTVVLFIAWQVG